MIRVSIGLLPPVLLLALSACASSADYPSLARRDAERIGVSTDAVAPESPPSPPPAPPSAELSGRLARLVEQAQAGHRAFAAKRATAERLVGAASGAAVGSESWSVASVAIADLDAARSDTVVALGTLDELYAAESVAASDSGSADAAAAAHRQVDGWATEEEGVLIRLRGRLKS